MRNTCILKEGGREREREGKRVSDHEEYERERAVQTHVRPWIATCVGKVIRDLP